MQWKQNLIWVQVDNTFLLTLITCCYGFTSGLDSKESVCNVGHLGLISGFGQFPGDGYPLQHSCLETPMDWEAQWAHSTGLQRVKGMTEQLTLSLFMGYFSFLKKCSIDEKISPFFLPFPFYTNLNWGAPWPPGQTCQSQGHTASSLEGNRK